SLAGRGPPHNATAQRSDLLLDVPGTGVLASRARDLLPPPPERPLAGAGARGVGGPGRTHGGDLHAPAACTLLASWLALVFGHACARDRIGAGERRECCGPLHVSATGRSLNRRRVGGLRLIRSAACGDQRVGRAPSARGRKRFSN